MTDRWEVEPKSLGLREAAERWIVEPKTRSFDVIDTAITPRADGFYCFCVDRDRAELIARLLNHGAR